MRYDNWQDSMPNLVERIKINMREQDVDFFDYTGEFKPVPLETKEIYIN